MISELIGELLMLSVPGYFILQFWLAYSWKGRWWYAALIPLLAIGPAMIFSAFALSKGSNLWPLTVVLLAPFDSSTCSPRGAGAPSLSERLPHQHQLVPTRALRVM